MASRWGPISGSIPMPTRLADYLAGAALALFIALLALASPTPAQAATAIVQAR